MKRLIGFLILLSTLISGQILTTEFPKIGFADMYFLQKYSAYSLYSGSTINYSSQNYFFPQLKNDLGLTHVVTYLDANSSGLSNPGLKILDCGFSTRAFDSYNSPYKYSLATGNHSTHFPYEVGGTYAFINSSGDNYGLGNSQKHSWWVLPTTVGVNTIDNGNVVVYATVAIQNLDLVNLSKIRTIMNNSFLIFSA